MGRLFDKPEDLLDITQPSFFERFNLTDNPFPSVPSVNKESTDKRNNGEIFEMQIRTKEFDIISERFLTQPQSNPNHLRMGYIIDRSYIGRGNGKSAFLINLIQIINKNFALDISKGKNKCFAIYISPDSGGRTKTFISFVDSLFKAILNAGIINTCLAILRLKAIKSINPQFDYYQIEENELVDLLNNEAWFEKNQLSLSQIDNEILKNNYLQTLPQNFPIFNNRNTFLTKILKQEDFELYYLNELKKPKDKIDFIFDDLIKIFLASDFNGAYFFVDDFERIPDFQSARQKRDFAVELRTCIFDGIYTNAKVGFINLFLVLHAGVPRLILDAWTSSGLENRAPISQLSFSNAITFEKLNKDHVSLLMKKYLSAYRIKPEEKETLLPFTDDVVNKMGELVEYNAAKILKMAYELLMKAASEPEITIIDEEFMKSFLENYHDDQFEKNPPIDSTSSIDLIEKSKGD